MQNAITKRKSYVVIGAVMRRTPPTRKRMTRRKTQVKMMKKEIMKTTKIQDLQKGLKIMTILPVMMKKRRRAKKARGIKIWKTTSRETIQAAMMT